jgi:hypothetical protein
VDGLWTSALRSKPARPRAPATPAAKLAAYSPFTAEGKKTVALEIIEQLGFLAADAVEDAGGGA